MLLPADFMVGAAVSTLASGGDQASLGVDQRFLDCIAPRQSDQMLATAMALASRKGEVDYSIAIKM